MNYLKNTNCYLSGPIDNDHTGIDWRTGPVKVLTERFGIDVFDPFSDPKQKKGPLIADAKEHRDKEAVARLVGDFVRKDLGKVDRTDFVIARFGYFNGYTEEDVEDFEIDVEYYHEDDGGSIMRIVPSAPRRMQIPTAGTIHEIITADSAHKPTLLVCEEGWWHIPGWLLGFIPSRYWFSSWEELYNYLQKVDNGECVGDRRWHIVYGLV